MLLYHATYMDNIESIKKNGLGAKQPKNWSFSEDGVVCFAKSAEEALSYAESSEEVSDEKYNSGIVVLATYTTKLHSDKLGKDKNVDKGEGWALTTFAYKGIIPSQELYVATKNGIVGKLNGLTEVPLYE